MPKKLWRSPIEPSTRAQVMNFGSNFKNSPFFSCEKFTYLYPRMSMAGDRIAVEALTNHMENMEVLVFL